MLVGSWRVKNWIRVDLFLQFYLLMSLTRSITFPTCSHEIHGLVDLVSHLLTALINGAQTHSHLDRWLLSASCLLCKCYNIWEYNWPGWVAKATLCVRSCIVSLRPLDGNVALWTVTAEVSARQIVQWPPVWQCHRYAAQKVTTLNEFTTVFILFVTSSNDHSSSLAPDFIFQITIFLSS